METTAGTQPTLEQRLAELDATLARLRSCPRQGKPPVPPREFALSSLRR